MNKIKVLIVEDDEFMRKFISDILKSSDLIEVIGVAVDGLDGLEKVKSLKPDVVSMDHEMPRMNGLDCLREIRKLPNPPKVVMVSGYVREYSDLTLQSLAAGASGTVLKTTGLEDDSSGSLKDELISNIVAASRNSNS